MDAQPKSEPEPTPFERMTALARRVMSVPKEEIDRRQAESKKHRLDEKRKKAA